MAKFKLAFVLVILSGGLLILGSPWFSQGWLTLVAFTPFLIAWRLSSGFGQAFRRGYWLGTIYFAITFGWLWETYPLKSLGLESAFWSAVLIFLTWGLTVLTQALPWGLAWGLGKKIDFSFSGTSLIVLPSLFLLFEYGRSYLISFLWIGSGSVIGPHWTIGNLAYSLAETKFLSLASVGGIYGLTFLIIFINVLVFWFLEKKRFRSLLVLSLVLIPGLALDVIPGLSPQTEPRSLKVAAVQSQIPSQPEYSSSQELEFLQKQLEALQKISEQMPDVDLIVFPEQSNFSTRLSLLASTPSAAQYFNRLFDHPALIADQLKIREKDATYSKTVYLDSQQGIVGTHDKRLLTPIGEFVPWLFRWLDQVLGLNSPRLRQAEEFRPGLTPPSAFFNPKLTLGVLVCSELFSPLYARRLSQQGSEIMAGQVSLGLMNGSQNLYRQMIAVSRLRAAENAKPFVFASNFAPALILDSQGRTVSRSFQKGFEILTGEIVTSQEKTVYNRVGDEPWIVAGLAVLATALLLRKVKLD